MIEVGKSYRLKRITVVVPHHSPEGHEVIRCLEQTARLVPGAEVHVEEEAVGNLGVVFFLLATQSRQRLGWANSKQFLRDDSYEEL